MPGAGETPAGGTRCGASVCDAADGTGRGVLTAGGFAPVGGEAIGVGRGAGATVGAGPGPLAAAAGAPCGMGGRDTGGTGGALVADGGNGGGLDTGAGATAAGGTVAGGWRTAGGGAGC